MIEKVVPGFASWYDGRIDTFKRAELLAQRLGIDMSGLERIFGLEFFLYRQLDCQMRRSLLTQKLEDSQKVDLTISELKKLAPAWDAEVLKIMQKIGDGKW